MIRALRWVRANILGILNVMKVALIGLMLILLINIQVSNAHQAQVTRSLVISTKHIADQIKEAVKEENANTNAQLAEANAHLDCIARFFAQTNRTNASIVDLNQCSIAHTGSSSNLTPTASPGANAAPVPSTGSGQTSSTAQAGSGTSSTPEQPATDTTKPGLVDRLTQDVVSVPSKLIHALTGIL